MTNSERASLAERVGSMAQSLQARLSKAEMVVTEIKAMLVDAERMEGVLHGHLRD